MIPWWMITCFIFLIEYSSINCIDNQCNYKVTKSDNSSDQCIASECYKFVDLISIMVQPRTCKTSIVLLSFTSYQNFLLFRNQLQWKIGDLFLSQSMNKDRQFILFLDQLGYNHRPFDHNELIQLGINIDLYIIYIRNIQNKNYLYGSIHYDPNNPEWNIIQIRIRCLKLSAFDEYPCSSEIVSPSLFAPQRPPLILQSTTNMTNLSNPLFSSSTTEGLNEQKKKSTDLILIIIIPILVILITMLLLISLYIYITGKYCCFDQDAMTTPPSLSKTSTSDHPVNIERISLSSSISDNTIVQENRFNVDHVQNPTIYHDYHRHTKTHSTNNLDSNYDQVTSDNISVIGQQYFVPISTSNHL